MLSDHTLDILAHFFFWGVALGLPALGYVVMARDFRAWLRSLRTSLVLVIRRAKPGRRSPFQEQPQCLVALGLKLPCSEADVLEAYRAKVKQYHPDRGGDIDRFVRLQRYFEEAVELVNGEQGPDRTSGSH